MSGSIEPTTGDSCGSPDTASIDRDPLTPADAARASRVGWDAIADDYQAEQGPALGHSSLLWGPEGLREEAARLLGPLAGRRVLEIGCGAAQGTRWVAAQGAEAVGIDISGRQLHHARALGGEGGVGTLVQADALRLPFGSGVFDSAFAAHGAVAFTGDLLGLHRDVARILRPGGAWVFSVTHPIRWCFPDDPGARGLMADRSYWDDRPYVERDDSGRPTYVEHHHTLGEHVRALGAAGFSIDDLVEPEWDPDVTDTWAGWSPSRGAVIPGTAIFVCHRG